MPEGNKPTLTKGNLYEYLAKAQAILQGKTIRYTRKWEGWNLSLVSIIHNVSVEIAYGSGKHGNVSIGFLISGTKKTTTYETTTGIYFWDLDLVLVFGPDFLRVTGKSSEAFRRYTRIFQVQPENGNKG